MQTGVYKFLHTCHIDDVLIGGRVKIASLSHYRNMESNDQWIADNLEGSVLIAPGEMVITENENRLQHLLPPSLANKHARASNGGKIIVTPGVKITVQHPDVFIFSASFGDLTELTKVMCRQTAEAYDACIRITDLQHFAHRLLYRGRVQELHNKKVADLFSRFECSEVKYDILARGPDEGQAPEASPFLKDVQFADQKELRIALFPFPGENIGHSTLIVDIPRPGQLLKEVFREFASVEIG
jgi:hypothetical protein